MRKSLHVLVLVTVLGMLTGGSLGAGAAGAESGHVVTIHDATITEGNGNFSPSIEVTVNVDPAPGVGEVVKVDFGTSAQALQGATATTTTPGDDSPTFPEDFAQTDGTVAFVGSLTEQTVSIPVLRDNADEANETFFVRLFNARKECLLVCADGASIGDASATVTITDDDTAPSIAISDVSHDEGDAPGTTTYAFTVTKNGGSAQAVSVDYASADGSATSPEDYEGTDGSFTFDPSSPDGSETRTVNVAVKHDTIFEPSETFGVNLSNASNATIGDGQGVGNIQNDDDPPPPSMDVGDVTADEGDALSFTVTLSSPPGPGQTATVDWALEGTEGEGNATEGDDYTPAAGSLLYTAGETEQTISVATVGDEVNELDEVFGLRLTKPEVGGTGGYNYNVADDTAVGTIANDDAAPTLSIDDVDVDAEGGAEDETVATFTVTKSGLIDRAVSVDYATTDGTASAGEDFTASLGTLNFTPEEMEKEITVPITGDANHEGDDSFVVELENASLASIADAFGIGTITNDDAAPTLAVSDVSVTEGNAGLVSANFTVTKTGPTALSASVGFATANGMALSGSDYDAHSATLTFAPSDVSKTVAVSVRGDLLDEWSSESYLVNLSGAQNASVTDGQGVGTIRDDDAAPAMSIGDGRVNETSTSICTLTVRLSAASGRAIGVRYATASGTAGTADYVAKSGELKFARGEVSKQVKVTARADTKAEGTERFSVKLSGVTPAGAATFADSTGTCSIIDND